MGATGPPPAPITTNGAVPSQRWRRSFSGVYVVEAGAKFKLLAHNTLKPDTSIFNAGPAFDHSQLLLRSDRYLYCIGKR